MERTEERKLPYEAESDVTCRTAMSSSGWRSTLTRPLPSALILATGGGAARAYGSFARSSSDILMSSADS
jgi:hypothetical protein